MSVRAGGGGRLGAAAASPPKGRTGNSSEKFKSSIFVCLKSVEVWYQTKENTK